jgi:hypothetical protein
VSLRQVIPQGVLAFTLDPAEVGVFWLHFGLRTLSPEKKLMCAMIEGAVTDIRSVRRPGEVPTPLRLARMHQRTEAIAWVYSDDTTWSHSFLNCCEELGWWPPIVRELIQREIGITEALVSPEHAVRSHRRKPTDAE